MFTNCGLEQLRRALNTESSPDWAASKPTALFLCLVNRVGELAGVFQWKAEAGSNNLLSLTAAEQLKVGQELSDVLLYLIRLADVCGIDLGRAALEKLAHNEKKYPKPTGSTMQHKQQPPPPPPPQLQQQQQQHAGATSPISLSTGLEDLISSMQQQDQHPLTATSAVLGHLPLPRPRSSSSGASSTSSRHSAAAAFITGLSAGRHHTGHTNMSPVQGNVPAVAAGQGAAAMLCSSSVGSASTSHNSLWSPPACMASVPQQHISNQHGMLQEQQQQQPQQQTLLHTSSPSHQRSPAARQHKVDATGAASFSASMPADDEVMHVGRATRLLPQGLLAEIEHGVGASSSSNRGSSRASSSKDIPCLEQGGSSSSAAGDMLSPPAATLAGDMDTPFVPPVTPPNGKNTGSDSTETVAAPTSPAAVSGLWLAAALAPGQQLQHGLRGTSVMSGVVGHASTAGGAPDKPALAQTAAAGRLLPQPGPELCRRSPSSMKGPCADCSLAHTAGQCQVAAATSAPTAGLSGLRSTRGEAGCEAAAGTAASLAAAAPLQHSSQTHHLSSTQP